MFYLLFLFDFVDAHCKDCICVLTDLSLPALNIANIIEASCGKCPPGTVPAANSKHEVETYIK